MLVSSYRAWLMLTAVIFGLAAVQEATAQEAAIEGRVVDTETGDPIPGANVFLDQTTRGTASRDDGSYAIPHLNAGSYRVVASMIGYVTDIRSVEIVPDQRQYMIEFHLRRALVELDELHVVGERPRSWAKNLQRFEQEYLGSSENARETELLNPFVLDFSTDKGELVARASAPLEIENRALGYRLTVALDNYRETGRVITMGGPVYFYELPPADDAEAARWLENRERTYRGSFMHLMRSLVRGNTRQEGFFVAHEIPPGAYGYGRRPRLDLGSMSFILPGTQPYLYRLSFENLLYIEFGRETSWLELTREEALLHEEGYLINPEYMPPPMRVIGSLSKRRLADMLPRDYRSDRHKP